MRQNKKFDLQVTGQEPTFNPDGTYSNADMIGFYNWYNYMYDATEARKFARSFCKNTKGFEQFIPAVDNVPTQHISTTSCWMMRMAERGLKLSAKERSYITQSLEHYQRVVDANPTPVAHVTKSIASRVENKAAELSGELEGMLDDFINNGYTEPYDIYSKMKDIGVKGAHTKYLIKHFKPILKELTAAANPKRDEQIAEAYSTTKSSDIKRMAKFVEYIVDTLYTVDSNAKAIRKPRKSKNKSAKKQISKLKYMKSYEPLKLVSVDPEKIVGAKAALVFNTANQQLTLYQAEADGFTVARSSIKNFVAKTSQTKRFGKQIKKLKPMMDMNRADIVKAFSKLSSTGKEASGRINDKMIILKVF